MKGFTLSGFGQYVEGVGTLTKSGGGIGGGSETLIVYKDTHTQMVVLASKERGGCAGGGKGYLGSEELAFTLSTNSDQNIMQEIVFQQNQREEVRLLEDSQVGALKKEQGTHNTNFIMQEIDYPVADTLTKCANQTTGFQGEVIVLEVREQPIVLDDQCGSVMGISQNGEVGTLRAQTKGHEPIVSYGIQANIIDRSEKSGGNGLGVKEEEAPTLTKGDIHAVVTKRRVRRLTPTEFARLQGFPDEHTKIPGATDAKEYSAYGNSMTVNVMRWLGKRIKAVDEILKELCEKP